MRLGLRSSRCRADRLAWHPYGCEAGDAHPMASTGFRLFWRWKLRPRGRPRLPADLQRLIAEMAAANRSWGEERIASELLLKLGIQWNSSQFLRSTGQKPGGCADNCEERGGPRQRPPNHGHDRERGPHDVDTGETEHRSAHASGRASYTPRSARATAFASDTEVSSQSWLDRRVGGTDRSIFASCESRLFPTFMRT
jgi:hypothetical protein